VQKPSGFIRHPVQRLRWDQRRRWQDPFSQKLPHVQILVGKTYDNARKL